MIKGNLSGEGCEVTCSPSEVYFNNESRESRLARGVRGRAHREYGSPARAVEEEEGGDGSDVAEGIARSQRRLMAQRKSGLREPTVVRIWSSERFDGQARTAMLSPCLRFNSPSHLESGTAGRAPSGQN